MFQDADDLVKSKKNSDMIVSKAKTIMWFVNGNAEKVHPECNLILLNKTAIGNFKRHLETLPIHEGKCRLQVYSNSTVGKVQCFKMPLEITDGGLVQQDEITLWVNLLCVAVVLWTR
jgi:hypothetical protein